MRKRWIDSLFWILNGLTFGAFAVLLLFTIWVKIKEGFHENLESVLATIIWGYMIFSIVRLRKYLSTPSPEGDFNFLWLSLGFILLVFLAILVAMTSIGGIGTT